MNPQNCGPHIPAHHSHLWRNSMFIQRPVPYTVSCHKQLNEYSTRTYQSWRTRENFIRTHNLSGFTRGSSLQPKQSLIATVLPPEKMQSSSTRAMVKSLLIDKTQLQNCQKLIEGMSKLKQMNLFKGRDLNRIKLPGVMRHNYVYNDYHSKGTNPGYSRGELGRHFAR